MKPWEAYQKETQQIEPQKKPWDIYRDDPVQLETKVDDDGVIGNAIDNLQKRGFEIAGNAQKAAGTLTETFVDKPAQALANITGFNPGVWYDEENGLQASWNMPQDKQVNIGKEVKALSDKAIDTDTGYKPDYTVEKFESDPSVKNFFGMLVEQGVPATADMVASVFGLPVYVASELQRLGDERARNNGKKEADWEDIYLASPGAIANVTGDRLLADTVVGKLGNAINSVKGKKDLAGKLGQVAKVMAGAGAMGAANEGVQEGVEYASTNAGTEAGFNEDEFWQSVRGGAYIGGGIGAAGRGVTGTYEAAIKRPDEEVNLLANQDSGEANRALQSELAKYQTDSGQGDALDVAQSDVQKFRFGLDQGRAIRDAINAKSREEEVARLNDLDSRIQEAKRKGEQVNLLGRLNSGDPTVSEVEITKPAYKAWQVAGSEEGVRNAIADRYGLPMKPEPPKQIGTDRIGYDDMQPPAGARYAEQMQDFYNLDQSVRPPSIQKQAADAKRLMPENYFDGRLGNEDYRYELGRMANELVRGGGIALIPSQENGVRFESRTSSLNPDWFKDGSFTYTNENGNQSNVKSVQELQTVIGKALTPGSKLSQREKRITTALLDVASGNVEQYSGNQADFEQQEKDLQQQRDMEAMAEYFSSPVLNGRGEDVTSSLSEAQIDSAIEKLDLGKTPLSVTEKNIVKGLNSQAWQNRNIAGNDRINAVEDKQNQNEVQNAKTQPVIETTQEAEAETQPTNEVARDLSMEVDNTIISSPIKVPKYPEQWTKNEYLDWWYSNRPAPTHRDAAGVHERIIRDALRDGKSVPSVVLKDYDFDVDKERFHYKNENIVWDGISRGAKQRAENIKKELSGADLGNAIKSDPYWNYYDGKRVGGEFVTQHHFSFRGKKYRALVPKDNRGDIKVYELDEGGDVSLVAEPATYPISVLTGREGDLPLLKVNALSRLYGDVATKSGKPFKTINAAKSVANKMANGELYSIIKFKDGYALRKSADIGDGFDNSPASLSKYAANITATSSEILSGNIRLSKSGKPFKSEKTARMSATFKETPNAEIVPVDGGFGVRESKPNQESNPAPQAEFSDATVTDYATKSKPSQETTRPGVIRDFGEKLGGARKDETLSERVRENMSDDEFIANNPLSKIWPMKEVEQIEDKALAAFSMLTRSEIPSKPRKSYKLKRWVEQVKKARESMDTFAENQEGFLSAMRNNSVFRNFIAKYDLLNSIDRNDWKRIGEVRDMSTVFTYEDGKKIPKPSILVEVDGRTIRAEGAMTIEDALPRVQDLLKANAKANSKKIQFEIRTNRYTDVTFINKKGDKDYEHLAEFTGDNKISEARKYKDENYADLVAAWDKVKERKNVKKSDIRSTENATRIGEDYRSGKDITPEEFMNTFGFRGVEFGNWVKQGKGGKERQGLLNDAYDAFMDLANVIGVPPKALSLNGSLGIGIGSRGRGGKASAHFEPDYIAISLTKTKGAGALAHEWFHALDNYFSRMRTGKINESRKGKIKPVDADLSYVTFQPEPVLVHKKSPSVRITRKKLDAYIERHGDEWFYARENWQPDPNHPAGIRPEVEAAFAELVETLDESNMKGRALNADGGKPGYWSEVIERAARSFENYVITSLKDKGGKNDFLANVVPIENWPREESRYPYLLEDEIQDIKDAFDNLFNTIDTKETEDGNIAIYEPNQSYNVNEGQQELLLEGYDNEPERTDVQRQESASGSGSIDYEGASSLQGTTTRLQEIHRQKPTRQIKTGLTKVNDASDVAHIFSTIRKESQERFVILVTDGDGNVLNLINHTKGLSNQTQISPATVAAAVANTPGAEKVWYGHNHPSGDPTPSDADLDLTRQISKLFDGTDIQVEGHVIVGQGMRAHYFNTDSNESTPIKTKPVPRSKQVSMTEREIVKRKPKNTPIVTSVNSAINAVDLVPEDNGIIFLTQQHGVVGHIGMSTEAALNLRKENRVLEILKAMDQTNAPAVLIKGANIESAENLVRYMNNFKGLGIRVLDGIYKNDSGTAYVSMVENFETPNSNTFFSRSDNDTAATPGTNRSMPIEDIQARVDVVNRGLADVNSRARVFVYEDIAQLPADVQQQIETENAANDFAGVYTDSDGLVHIYAPNITNETHLEEVILHELEGHFGLRKLFGDEVGKNLLQVYNLIGGEKGIKRWLDRNNIKMPNDYYKEMQRRSEQYGENQGKMFIADEFLSHIAGNRAKESLPAGIKRRMNEILASVVQTLRKLGLNKLADMAQTNDSLIYGTLRQARKAVKSNKRAGELGGSLFSMLEKDNGKGSPAWEAAKAKGLDMSHEARMQRARDMGFDTDTVYYHGTDKSFDGFDPEKLSSSTSHASASLGFFFTKYQSDAETYIEKSYFGDESVGKYKKNASLIPVYLKMENAYEMPASEFLGILTNRPDLDALREDVEEVFYDSTYRLERNEYGELYVESIETGRDVDIDSLPDDLHAAINKYNEANEEYQAFDFRDSFYNDETAEKFKSLRDELKEDGYDSVIIKPDGVGEYEFEELSIDQFVILNENNIRSINAAFDPENADSPNIMFSRKFDDTTEEQEQFLSKIGRPETGETIKTQYDDIRDKIGLKIKQGLVDKYAPLLEIDKAVHGENVIKQATQMSSWVLARMSEAGASALSVMLSGGRIKYNSEQKVINPVEDGTKGFLNDMAELLGSSKELDRFLGWVAAKRSVRLLAEGREHLFTEQEVGAGLLLDRGEIDGKSRPETYLKAFQKFKQYQNDVLDIATEAGLISKADREVWEDQFYVPFYRVDEDAKGNQFGVSGGSLKPREAYKKLKGGKQNLNDLLENTLLNWNHLLSNSMKNIATKQAIDNAVKAGVAEQTTDAMKGKQAAHVYVDGKKKVYDIHDEMVFDALTMLTHSGMNNFMMKAMRAFKRVFTNFTTASPQFIIANLIRDSLQAVAVTDGSNYNVAKNLKKGAQKYGTGLFKKMNPDRARILAAGGSFSFGYIYGRNPDDIKYGIDKEVGKVIKTPGDAKAASKLIWRSMRTAWDKYQSLNDMTENVNRMAIYDDIKNETGNELYAAFQARDLMDFSAHGAWTAIRFLTDVVPFLNARLQGLDKIYRSGIKPTGNVLFDMFRQEGEKRASVTDKQLAMRFSAVTGAILMATLVLRAINEDDEEYRKLEDWQKDTYWFINAGDGDVFFIPKPFEVGAIATMGERLFEQAISDNPEVDAKLFWKRVGSMFSDTFSFDYTPQMFKPVMELWGNQDSFTGRPIEYGSMQSLSADRRETENTTYAAKVISSGTSLLGDYQLSPVQADHLIQGYFGWVGTMAAGTLDVIINSATGKESPAKEWYEYQPFRRFYRNANNPSYTKYNSMFYEYLKESNQIYSDIRDMQKYDEEYKSFVNENKDKLKYRKFLNRVQRKLSAINTRMKIIKRSDNPGELKRQELDLLQTRKNKLQEMAVKKVIGE